MQVSSTTNLGSERGNQTLKKLATKNTFSRMFHKLLKCQHELEYWTSEPSLHSHGKRTAYMLSGLKKRKVKSKCIGPK